MKIGIDARLWNESGVGRYIRNLTINLAKMDKKNQYVIFVQQKDIQEVEAAVDDKWKIVSSNFRWHSVSEQINFPRIIDKENLDLMHFPYHSVPIFYRSPFIVTLHDLIPLHFSTGNASTLPTWLYAIKFIAYRFVVNTASANAKKVIAVSNYTKDDIIDNLRVNKRNIEVVYEAADDFKKISKSGNQGNYFLYVGNVYPHKNVEKLIEAFESFVKVNSTYSLVFAGKEDDFYKRLRKSNKKLEKAGVIRFNFGTTDEELSSLYQGATALIRPSLSEGFSLPPLEALQSGCIVLASDIPVHREIFKDSILYFDPTSVKSILEALDKVKNLNVKQKQELLSKGKDILKNFSWEKTARQTLKVYEDSLSL